MALRIGEKEKAANMGLSSLGPGLSPEPKYLEFAILMRKLLYTVIHLYKYIYICDIYIY
jgi:hypothetical protein